MGAAGDRDAVTDPAGRVHGVEGFRVIDASIMPTIPRGNTNIPTIMLAEKIADEMLRRARIERSEIRVSIRRRSSVSWKSALMRSKSQTYFGTLT